MQLFKRAIRALYLASALIFSANLAAQQLSNETIEETPPHNIMVVMDSSGSMWGQIEGETKRDIARAALRNILPQLPPKANIGLVAYGHRKKSECQDIELLRAPRPDNRVEIAELIGGLKPLGKTPLTDAVRRAADSLSIEDVRSTVILITDGVETCDADPCALGTELQSRGIDFTAHVIGFGLSATEGQQIVCLAESTGGLYIDAQNSNELGAALETVSDDLEITSKPIEDNEAPGKATLSMDSNIVVAGSPFKVEWTGPKNSLDSLLVRSLDGKLSYDRRYIYQEEVLSPSEVSAPEMIGDYYLHYETRQGVSLAKLAFSVIAADATLQVTNEPVVANTRFKVSFTGPENQFDRIVIERTDAIKDDDELGSLYVKQAKQGELSLLAPAQAGDFSIEYQTRGGRALAADVLTVIEPDAWIKTSDSEVTAGAYFETAVSDNSGEFDKLIIVNPTNKRKPIDYGFIQHAKKGKLKLIAPLSPGAYELQYINREEKVLASGTITVVAPDTSLEILTDVITAGGELIIGVSSRHGEADQVAIVALEAADSVLNYVYLSGARENKLRFFALPKAGRYSLQYRNRDGEVLAAQAFTINP